MARIRADLSARLALVAEQAQTLAATGDTTNWDGTPWPIAWVPGTARVTFIDGRGVVKGDSRAVGEASNASRTTQPARGQAALQGRSTDEVRFSATRTTTALTRPRRSRSREHGGAPEPAAGGGDQAVARLAPFSIIGGLVRCWQR